MRCFYFCGWKRRTVGVELDAARIRAPVLPVVDELRERVTPAFHRAVAAYEAQPVLRRLG